MPTPLPAPRPPAPPRWRDNWGHFVIVLPIIGLGCWAIHAPVMILPVIGLEMVMFRNHAMAKHPEHPILQKKGTGRAYSLCVVGLFLAFASSTFQPIRGLNQTAAAAFLMTGYIATSEVVHQLNHWHQEVRSRDWKSLSTRDAATIQLLAIAVALMVAAVLIANL